MHFQCATFAARDCFHAENLAIHKMRPWNVTDGAMVGTRVDQRDRS